MILMNWLLRNTTGLASIIIILSTVSCVYVPYPVPADIEYIEISSFPESSILTLGPRKLLDDIAEAITETDDNIEVVDGVLFRDTAFPNGGWFLNQMLVPETCFRVNKELDIDYLILVSTEGVKVGADEGFFIPLALGIMASDEEYVVDAMLLDLKTGKTFCRISSEAHGKEKIFYYVIFIVASGPATESSAILELGEEIVKAIRAHTNSEIRIAIMAIENLEVVATQSRKEILLSRYNEGDDSYVLLTDLALLGATEPLEQLAWKGDIKAAIYLYDLTGISGPLDKLAEDGNQLAISHKIGRQSNTHYTSQQEHIKVEQSTNERKRTIKEKELESELTTQAEAGDPKAQFELYMLQGKTQPEWLCRSADQGYTKAEMWLGFVLESGFYGFSIDNAQSYLWYRRAAIGEHQQEVEKEIKRIKKESIRWLPCKGISCSIAQNIVDLEGKLGNEGLSNAKNMLDDWEPGQCEQRFVDTKSTE